MNVPDTQVIVDFDAWCCKCEYGWKPETVYPCCECLTKPVSWNSERPAFFKDKSTKISQRIMER